jgi:hypothetical protein
LPGCHLTIILPLVGGGWQHLKHKVMARYRTGLCRNCWWIECWQLQMVSGLQCCCYSKMVSVQSSASIVWSIWPVRLSIALGWGGVHAASVGACGSV